jgi:2-dehydropantoate 2-reductase
VTIAEDGRPNVETLVIGSGSLGSLLAARLAAGGNSVTLFGRTSPHLERIASKWLTVEEAEGSRLTVRVRTATYGQTLRRPNLAIVAVKTWATDDAIRPLLPALQQVEAVLTLQNGLGNAQRLRKLLPDHITVLTGVTTQAALRTDPGVVRDTGPGETWIGSEYTPDDPATIELVNRTAAMLSQSGWPSSPVLDILPQLWMKLAVNAAINPLTALTRATNGDVAADPNLAQLAAYLASEAAAVAASLGIVLDRPVERALEVARATGENRSSMLRDIELGRRTEIEAITGAVHDLGEKNGVNTPITTMMTILLNTLERNLLAAAEPHVVPTSPPDK